MSITIRCLILALTLCGVTAAEMKIAQVNLYQIEPLVRQIVLDRAENQAIKKQIEELDRQQDSLNGDLASKFNQADGADEALTSPSGEHMKKMTAIYSEKSRLEESIKQQVKGELIKVVRLVAADRYAFVLDSQNLANAVIVKSGELVDITLDVRDHLLAPK